MNRTTAALSFLSRADAVPSLVLFVGAFLVLAAGAAFAQVASIPLPTKFVLLLAATAALAGTGQALRPHRQLVLAGSAFTFTAALLVPIDLAVLAYIVLDIPKIAVELLWGAGSLAAAGLYAVLAASGYGRAFSYLWFLFTLHGVGRFVGYFDGGVEWYLVAAALVALLLEGALAALADVRLRGVVEPVARATRILAATAGLLGAWGHLEWVQGRWNELAVGPYALLWLAVALTAYYALRSRLGDRADRNVAAVGPLVVYYAAVRTVTAPTLEVIAAPVGLYLIAAAAWSERAVRLTIAPRDRESLYALGSALVLAPLIVARLDLVMTTRALLESLIVLVAGAALRRPRVAVIGALSVGVLGIRMVVGGLGTYGPWVVFGIVGVVLLGLGAVLLRGTAADRPIAQVASED